MTQMLVTKEEPYIKRYNAVHQKCREHYYDSVMISPHVQATVQDILQRDHLCRNINVLGIGSGDGSLDIEIARIIREEIQRSKLHHQTKVSSISLEINECFQHIFQESLKDLPISLLDGNATFEFFTKSFEDFIADENLPSTKFHIIHFIHSIYFFQIEKALMKCLDTLMSDSGKIFCIVTGKGDISYELCNKQGHLSATGEPISTEQILEVVKKHGWKYKESTTEFTIDVTELFDEDSVEGNYLLDFMTQTLHFRATADPKTVRETMEMVKELTIIENGRRLGKRRDKLLMIEK